MCAGGWDKNSPAGKNSSSALTSTVASEGLADGFMAFNTNYHDTGTCVGVMHLFGPVSWLGSLLCVCGADGHLRACNARAFINRCTVRDTKR